MDASTAFVIAILVVLVIAIVAVIGAGRRRSTAEIGTLSHETVRSDATRGDVPATVGGREVEPARPLTEEELGVSRRQFLNRGIVLTMALCIGTFGASVLAFLWPSAAGGFGSKIKLSTGYHDILSFISSKQQPYYEPEARTYMVTYPKGDLSKAKKVYQPVIYQGMAQYGLVALYQKCVHLGCKVPFCQSSQWFECPCHGSKYSFVGEKKGGPAPRGLDRFAFAVSGESVTVDTSNVITGPPVGTNTTDQAAAGPHCVAG